MTPSLLSRLKAPLLFALAGATLAACGPDQDSYAYYQGRRVRIAQASPYEVDHQVYARRPDLAARTYRGPVMVVAPRRPTPRYVAPAAAPYERPVLARRRTAPVAGVPEPGTAAYDPSGGGRSGGGGGGGGGGW